MVTPTITISDGMHSACGSCGARVVWLRHVTTGKAAPIDADPSPAGNILWGFGGYTVLAKTALAETRASGQPLYTSHFATCPQAHIYRGKGRCA